MHEKSSTETTYGGFTKAEIEAAAVKMFDPERLHPSSDGAVLLVHLGDDEIWKTTGFDSGWHVEAVDGRREVWPDEQVFDPYDARALAIASATGRCPVRPHEDPQEKVARVEAALEGLRGEGR